MCATASQPVSANFCSGGGFQGMMNPPLPQLHVQWYHPPCSSHLLPHFSHNIVPLTLLQLSPAPEEQDFLYHLGDREGVSDLYDLNNTSTNSASEHIH